MSNAESSVTGLTLRLTSPQFLAETLAILVALVVAFAVARAAWRTPTPATARGRWSDRLLDAFGV